MNISTFSMKTMPRLLIIMVVGGLCGETAALATSTDQPFKYTECDYLPDGAGRWKAEILLSKPVALTAIVRGEVSYIQDDGGYLEMTGSSDNGLVCITVQGLYVDQEVPVAEVQVLPLHHETDLSARELRSLRMRRCAGFRSTPAELPDGVDQLILMCDVYFENFGFGNMSKPSGLFGGEKGDGAYDCNRGNNPPTCFSLRYGVLTFKDVYSFLYKSLAHH